MKGSLDFEGVQARISRGAELGVQLAASEIATISAERAPILDGFLRASVVIAPQHSRESYAAVVAFTMVYAKYQHEGVHFRHPKGGQAKFLESAINDNQQRVLEIIANNIKAVMS